MATVINARIMDQPSVIDDGIAMRVELLVHGQAMQSVAAQLASRYGGGLGLVPGRSLFHPGTSTNRAGSSRSQRQRRESIIVFEDTGGGDDIDTEGARATLTKPQVTIMAIFNETTEDRARFSQYMYQLKSAILADAEQWEIV